MRRRAPLRPRQHLGGPDGAFLAANWANIKRALDFLIAEDANADGVSEARQHNTLDADWYGRVPEHISLYAAALKAGRARWPPPWATPPTRPPATPSPPPRWPACPSAS